MSVAGHAVGSSRARAAAAPTGRATPSSLGYAAVAATLFVVIMGNNIPSPLYGVYQQRWGFSAATLTGVFAVAAVAVLPTLLLFGAVSDRVGRKRVLLLALAFTEASNLVFLGAQGVGWLVGARLLAGVGIGLCAGTASAALAELQPARDHTRAALAAAVVTVLGQAVGPLLSGILVQYAPGPTVTVFLVDAALLLAVGAVVLAAPEPVPAPDWSGFRPRPQLSVPRAARPAFVVASLAALGAFAVLGLIAALGPTFTTQLLHEPNRAIGGGVVFLLLACSAAAQIVARRTALRRLLVVGPALLVAGLVLILVSEPAVAVPLFAVGTGVAGVGQGLSYVGGQRLLDQQVDDATRAATFSSYFLVLYVGTAVGALTVGVLTGPLGFFPAVLAVSVVVALLAAATVVAAARTGALRRSAPGGPR